MFEVKIECPQYYGAEYPDFNKNAINESRFDILIRLKQWSVEEKGDKLILHWISQEYEPYYEGRVIPRFMKEVKRYFNEVKPEGIKTVEVIVYNRSYYPEVYYSEEFNIGDEYHYTDEELYGDGRFTKWKKLLDEGKLKELSEELSHIFRDLYHYSEHFYSDELSPFEDTVIRDNPELKSAFKDVCEMAEIY